MHEDRTIDLLQLREPAFGGLLPFIVTFRWPVRLALWWTAAALVAVSLAG